MTAQRGDRQIGVAIFEAALLTTLIAAFGFAAAGVAGYLMELRSVRTAVDTLAPASSLRPFELENTADGEVRAVVQIESIRKLLSESANAIARRIADSETPEEEISVETGFAVMRIDMSTGRFLGFSTEPEIARSIGSRSGPSRVGCPGVVEQLLHAPSMTAGSVSAWAISAATRAPGGRHNFLPSSVVIAIRASKKLSGASRGLIALTGTETVVCAAEIDVLRGEVG